MKSGEVREIKDSARENRMQLLYARYLSAALENFFFQYLKESSTHVFYSSFNKTLIPDWHNITIVVKGNPMSAYQ